MTNFEDIYQISDFFILISELAFDGLVLKENKTKKTGVTELNLAGNSFELRNFTTGAMEKFTIFVLQDIQQAFLKNLDPLF
jgi:hypothetical protein